MSTSNSDGIMGFYSHMFETPDFDAWYMSNKFKIKGVDDCNFEIGVQDSQNKGNILTVAVMKDNQKSVSAHITISFRDKEIAKNVDNWTRLCAFAAGTSGATNRVKINCKIIWYGTFDKSSTIQAPLNSFSDFKNFHLNSSLSDFKISISGEELSVHKFILAAHSPVFLSMFETNMKEKRENRIVIEEIELGVMKIVLSILYTGYDKDLDDVEMVKKVLIVAERYGMTILKRLCEWKLFQKLEISNVLEILDKADTCNSETLAAACINFIIQNKKQMAESEDLETICHRKPSVMCGLLKTMMNNP